MLRRYCVLLVVLLQICLSYSACVKTKRVCVIGAGIAGLASARYLKDKGINFTVLEATQYVGGTWRYDPRTGTDENGQPLHTSMYKNLRTNLPKPTMELKDFRLPDHLPSFPSWRDYYRYLQAYAKHFDILKYIKFLHNVVHVRRVGDVWKVKHEHVLTKETFEEEYDYVIVGNGHFSKPNMPNIPGEELFKGKIIHSHDYREPEPYRNRRVLVVGAGPSGMDIGLDVADVASHLFHSHHSRINFTTPFPPQYHKKPDIQELNETGVIFKDGSYEEVDDVIYCTGFHYYCPFLDESSGLTVHPKSVVPLYRYMVNINQPSMIMMGLVVRACLVVALDAQLKSVVPLYRYMVNINQPSMIMMGLVVRACLVVALDAQLKSVVPLYRYMVNINQPSMIMMGLVVRACLVVALDAQLKSVVPLYRYMVNINQPSMIMMGLVVRACLVVALDAQLKSVVPLYRYMVNINQPSMIMMGLVVRACLVVALDAQARYATALIAGNFTLPPRDEMMQEWQKRMDTIRSKGQPESFIHILAEKEDQYYAEISEESGTERVPPVMFKIRALDTEAKLENLYTYRNYEYTVIDDHTFTRKVEDPAIRSRGLNP
ncbi:hypothetical protein PYW07_007959 [Mythimna separata]|uniref:Flavin-containing monooxygenase n=1 Tax=Mythimna separata TaxID=271217 RepID=A0AAD8DUE4_MYTSE|nr:hypothetical protein PYW07_007959 [Mythimna separata]